MFGKIKKINLDAMRSGPIVRERGRDMKIHDCIASCSKHCLVDPDWTSSFKKKNNKEIIH